MRAAIEQKVDYLHYLQGADLPLKTPDEIDAFFARAGEDNVEFVDVAEKSGFARYKVLCKHFFCDNKFFRDCRFVKVLNHSIASLQKPFLPPKDNLYSGSACFSISSDFAKYVLSKEEEIRKRYRFSLAADEVFLQTIIMDSAFSKRVYRNGNLRYIDWNQRDGNSPYTFRYSDFLTLNGLIENPEIMFARKFDEKIDYEIVKKIEQTIRARAESRIEK